MKIKKSKLLFIAVIVVLALVLFNTLSEEQQSSAVSTVTDLVEILGDSDSGKTGPQSDPVEKPAEKPSSPSAQEEPVQEPEAEAQIDEDGVYDSKEDVALYIHTYGKLPSNYVTKKEAEKAGWPGGSLEKYCPGKCIGGSFFGNYEGLLPDVKGRKWTECDIDTLGASSRGAKRIIFSNDGLIYYTDDHYESFELLYGEP